MPRTERKRGLLSRFRRNKPKGPPSSVQVERRSVAFDKRESSPSPPVTTATRDEAQASLEQPTQTLKVDAEPRVVTPPSAKSGDQSTASSRKSKLPFRSEVILDKAPTARESAFGGPPRYDWIDIVSLLLLQGSKNNRWLDHHGAFSCHRAVTTQPF